METLRKEEFQVLTKAMSLMSKVVPIMFGNDDRRTQWVTTTTVFAGQFTLTAHRMTTKQLEDKSLEVIHTDIKTFRFGAGDYTNEKDVVEKERAIEDIKAFVKTAKKRIFNDIKENVEA